MVTMEVAEKTYTIEEFLELELPDDQTFELIKGKIVPKGLPSGKHGKVVLELSRLLGNYLADNPIGDGFTEAGCTLGRPQGANWVRPDLCFVAKGRLADNFDGPFPVAPDFIIEVNSPSDTNQAMQDKVEEYLAEGVRLIWSIYIVQKFVVVYRLGDPNIQVMAKGVLDDENILPGFKVPLAQLF
jgi:Uma2 family endonuclease